jgi:hypothetical protein
MNDLSYPEIKRELPEDLIRMIKEANVKLSDPAVLEPGNEILHCAGIIGNSHRNAFRLKRICEFSDRLVIKRSPFGDILSGPT